MRDTMIQPVYARRLHELEQTFAALEPQIHESPEKQAFSLLHGMVQELWRGMQTMCRRSCTTVVFSLAECKNDKQTLVAYHAAASKNASL
jgi:hypothetical protein